MLLFTVGAGCSEKEPSTVPAELLESPYLFSSGEFFAAKSDPPPLIELGGEARPVMDCPTPSECRFEAQVPVRPFLTFAIGIAANPAADPSASIPGNRLHFSVRVGEPLKTPNDEIFRREIHVARQGQWIDQVVDLSDYAGQRIWIDFETSAPGLLPGDEPPVDGLFAEPVVHDRARYREGRGLVIISIDTLRRDHLSLYGYPRKTAPALSRVTRDAIVFDDMVSTSSWTLPAHASLFTSSYPSVHGAVDASSGLSPDLPGLAGLLADEGFLTQAMVTHLYLSKSYGMDVGFERHLYLPQTRATEVTNRAVGFLETKGDRDFFLFLHYYDPHWHYDPPEPFDRMFDATYDGEASGIWWDFKSLTKETIAPRDLNHIRSLYDGEIAYTDSELGRLVREMKRLGLYDKSLIIVTSDHGEEFLEHGSWEHQKTLYDEQLRIPLIAKLPEGALAGLRVTDQVSLIDVAPTAMAILGLEVPDSFQGRNLLPALEQGDSLSPAEAWAETEHTLDGSHKVALRRGASGRKSIFTIGEDGEVAIESFELGRDPLEQDARDTDEAARRRLEAFLEFARTARQGRSAPGVRLAPDQEQELRSLGYIR